MTDQQYCLKWNNFSQHLKYAFNTIWSNDDSFTDVTLAVQGGFQMRAHKMVLSACSYYFKGLLVRDTSDSPVLILHDVSRPELEALVHFMYHGEVNVTQDVIPGLLKAAEMLQIRGLCASPAQGLKTSGAASTPTSRIGKRPASEIPRVPVPAKRGRRRVEPVPASLLLPAAAESRGRSSVESEDSRDTNGVGTRDTNGSGGSDNDGDGQLRIDEESNGLEPETLLDEQDGDADGDADADADADADGDGWSQDSGATDDQFYPLPRADAASPQSYTATARLKNLAVKIKLEPKIPNDLEAAIVSSMPKNDGSVLGAELTALSDDQQRYLAFHEPRPCQHCQRMYRDAATLRTHVAIMHSEEAGSGAPPVGALTAGSPGAGSQLHCPSFVPSRRAAARTWIPPSYIPLVPRPTVTLSAPPAPHNRLDPVACTCGALFRTKHDMYVHKKNGHR